MRIIVSLLARFRSPYLGEPPDGKRGCVKVKSCRIPTPLTPTPPHPDTPTPLHPYTPAPLHGYSHEEPLEPPEAPLEPYLEGHED